MKTKLPFILICLVALTSCGGPKIFYTEDAQELAQSHKMIAVVPPTVSIAPGKKSDPEAIKEQQRTESLNFQKEIYSWMLKRKMQGKITPEIMDVETTNAKLTEVGYPGKAMTPAEICNVLGVDGIINSNFALSKPMSEGAAIAVAVLGGGRGATNEVNTSVSITDAANKKMIWNFDHKFSGGLGSSAADLVDDLMKQASKKMPYIQK